MAEDIVTPATPATPAVTMPTQQQATVSDGTFSAQYVKELREEAKTNRITAQGLETGVRKAFNLQDGEPIGDIAERINALQSSTLESANKRIIKAEIKSLQGYNANLIDRLITDYSTITVAEDGTVSGLKELLSALEKDVPEIKMSGTVPDPLAPGNPAPGIQGSGSSIPPENKAMNDIIRGRI